jgi:hypothetical protein
MKTDERVNIFFKTKRGGGGAGVIPVSEVSQFLNKQFRQRLSARVEHENRVIGEVMKNPEGKWTWYCESEFYIS